MKRRPSETSEQTAAKFLRIYKARVGAAPNEIAPPSTRDLYWRDLWEQRSKP